ncbi:unnamed protein product [Spirodela intermedia]|uniref:FAD-binding PCMH-type domain-containing protein n=1 Tax=Spirodela intermedia TaxID=51605 RepID=A0A7I8IJC6_SPIIN|nr:unnamed protein product [Spirodela intermedia]CAA6657989.1 unnamed protein product [Spirodela intermedia]
MEGLASVRGREIVQKYCLSGPEESFLNCFHDRHPDASTGIVHARGSEAYNAIYRSNIQNVRFLYSAAAKPAVLVTPASESHVQSSVICGKTSRLRVRVRSGGHDYEGMSYVSEGEGFLVVDLVNLRSLTVDIAKGSAWVAAGATVGELYYRIAKASPTPASPPDYAPLGGGIGTMLRKYGTAADNIIDARLVDAQGRLLDRSSMGKTSSGPSEEAGGRASGSSVIAEATDAPQSPMGRTVHLRFNSLFLGTRDELLPLMRRNFPDLGLKAEDCKEMTWIESTLYFAGLSGRRPEALLDRSPGSIAPSRPTSGGSSWRPGESRCFIMDPFGGKMDEIPETAIAFPHRRGNLFNIQYFMRWSETEEVVTRGHLDWMRKLYAFMEPYVSSNPRAAYVNYRDVDLGRPARPPRLAAVKSRVDRENFFRNEQSIPPSMN